MKICILHRYPEQDIKQTNAAFPYFVEIMRKNHFVDIKTFKKFDRTRRKWFKSLWWIFYAPLLVIGKHYDLIYCDDSFPFYPLLVKLASPKSSVYVRLGDLHLMYYCSGWSYKILHAIEKFVWRKVDLLIPITNIMRDFICSEGKFLDKTLVVKDPIDLQDFPYMPDRIKDYDVCFHGTLNKNKGIDLIIKTARKLPGVSFVIFGDCNGRLKIESRSPKNVHFVGWKDYPKIADYLSAAKVGIAMRSDNPGNDYVITQAFLQYAAVGTFVLVSDRKTFKNYPYAFDVKNSQLLSFLIRDSLENFNDYKKYIIEKNRKIVEEEHDARTIAAELVSICCLSGARLS